jgi:DNA segregation ATPase FtsK/SpoIIIE, S-DNA-T family
MGGVPLYYLYRDLSTFSLQQLFSDVGIAITFTSTAVVSFILLADVQILPLIEKLVAYAKKIFNRNPEAAPQNGNAHSVMSDFEEEQAMREESTRTLSAAPPPLYPPSWPTNAKRLSLPKKEKQQPLIVEAALCETPPSPPSVATPLAKKLAALTAQKVYNGDFTTYQLPPLTLLNNARKIDSPTLKKDLRRQAEILEETLMSFGIEAKVGEIHCGPTITSFEVHPAVGVKVQKITALESDIALNLQAKAIRIIAPIPGKAAVGVEIPAIVPQEVSFKELLAHYQNQPRKFFIPVLLGKAVGGENVISDLARMPHAIIAGATGSGKSVCINTIVMSILMNARPDEIKLLMIDPKKVELTCYSQLPHLLAPVITEPHGAYAALNWLVKEMQQRYEILKQLGLRNIGAFNNRQINHELETSLNIQVPARMPGIVAIIDEFADLMMVSSSDLETPVARIAQMARAVGIHLILATQRPSREVITGLIKANFPTRIAFKVASRINSQIILDENGAESLLGNGDMLFLPPGTSSLIRAQGAYISDEEINRVVDFICNQAPPNYLISSFDTMQKEDDKDNEEFNTRDALFEQARSIVVETGTASTTFLQRKLKIGYARAASLMDELEMRGIISPQEGTKPRRVLQTAFERSNKEMDGG